MNSTIGDEKKEDLKTKTLLEMQEPTEGLIGELDLFFGDPHSVEGPGDEDKRYHEKYCPHVMGNSFHSG